MRRIALAAVLVALAAMQGCPSPAGVRSAAAATAGLPHLQDRAFLLTALELDLAQIRLGRLAAEKARDPRVRAFAGRVAEHHQGSSVRLARLARARGLAPPTEISPLARRTQALLGRLDGPRFDAEYLASQVIWDYSALFGYRREARHGFDPALRREAQLQARVMDEHRDEAQTLAASLDASPAPAGGLHPEDRSFLLYAMHTDLVQVELGRIAAEEARDEQVRSLARRMVDHHQGSYERLAGIAKARGVEPLREVSSVARRLQDGLRRLDGSPLLDWQYVNAQAINNYAAFYRYEREAIHGRDPELRELAAEAAREAKEHHDAALAIVGDWRWGGES